MEFRNHLNFYSLQINEIKKIAQTHFMPGQIYKPEKKAYPFLTMLMKVYTPKPELKPTLFMFLSSEWFKIQTHVKWLCQVPMFSYWSEYSDSLSVTINISISQSCIKTTQNNTENSHPILLKTLAQLQKKVHSYL